MTRIPALDPTQAAPQAQELLAAVKAKFGMTPNMMKTMAHSAPVLAGYLALNGALAEGVLPARVREQIALAVAQANGCEYCLAAHSTVGRLTGLTPTEITDSRRAAAADPKTAAILAFVQELVVHKGAVEESAVADLRAAGVSDAEIAETVAHVALSIFTNYFNLVAETVVDFPRVPLALSA